jgi:hypothetical protein
MFGSEDVAILVVPHPGWQAFYASWIEGWAGESYARRFQSMRAVVMSDNGEVIQDSTGVWA